MVYYQHTQNGYLLNMILLGAMALNVWFMFEYAFSWVALGVLIFLAVLLVLFSSLTIVIDDEFLRVRFGPGLIEIPLALKNMTACRVVKNPWYYGWGIRRTPHGWLYNISGSDAVEITMEDGRKVRIGTDEPLQLEQALLHRLSLIKRE